MRRALLTTTLLAAIAAAVLYELGSVPAISLDEAWIGLFAMRLGNLGLYTPHQMNDYTGPLYAWVVSLLFGGFGASTASLRAFGAALNLAAVLLAWRHLSRRVSPEAGLAWLALLAASPYFLLKARLAWEVYAFHPILIALTLPLLRDAVSGRPGRAAAGLALLAVVGTQNHFIYLSVPVSLCVLFTARAAWRGETACLPALRANAASFAAAAAFVAVKKPLTIDAWQAARGPWAVALVLAPACAAAAAWAVPPRVWERALERLRAPGLARAAKLLLAGGILAYIIWHFPPVIQILAGPVVFKRLFGLDLSALVDAPLYAWALVLGGVLVWRAVRAWHDRGGADAHALTLALWPAAYAAVFIAFRHTSSLRYYSLSFLVAATALAAGAEWLAKADRRPALGLALVFAGLTQGLLWRELLAPGDRRPLRFKVGWRRENSVDFARKDAVFAAFDASRACRIKDEGPPLMTLPLILRQYGAGNGDCDPSLVFHALPCPDCPAAPYYRWTVSRR